MTAVLAIVAMALFSPATLKAEEPVAETIPAATAAERSETDSSFELDTVVVSASRNEQQLRDIPRSVTVLQSEQIDEVLTRSKDLSSLLALTIPGLGPSINDNLSNKGQNHIRGRRVLFLINGVAQNNAFLDFGQESGAIDPNSIERIEVIRGGSAVYGLGAQGGIINVITKKPGAGGPQFRTRFSGNVQDDGSDSLGGSVYQEIQGGTDIVQGLFGLEFLSKGGSFDGDGNRIPSAGNRDHMDEFSLNGTVNIDFDQDRSLSFLGFFRQLERNDIWYSAGDSDAAAERPNTAITDEPMGFTNLYIQFIDLLNANRSAFGLPPVEGEPRDFRRQFHNYQLSYQDVDTPLGGFNSTIYYLRNEGRNSTSLNADRTQPSPLDEILAVAGTNTTKFQKYGLKTSFDSTLHWFDITWGGDAEWQEYTQPSNFEFRSLTPDFDQVALAGFAQLESRVTATTLLSGGLRYEHVTLDVDDFIVSEAFPNAGTAVAGGEPSFGEFLFNIGLVQDLPYQQQFFLSFAQGISVSEAMRDIRAGDAPSVDAAVEPIKTDNYEVGFRGDVGPAYYTLAAFFSRSPLGATLERTEDRLDSVRAPEEVWGAEASLELPFSQLFDTYTTISWQEGRRKLNGEWEPLDGARIAPLKFTTSLGYNPTLGQRYTLDFLYSGSRDESDEISRGARFPVDSYSIFNLGAHFDFFGGTLSLGIENLFDKSYIAAYPQSFGDSDIYYNAPGRRYFLTYEIVY